jgi:hypothetical protein
VRLKKRAKINQNQQKKMDISVPLCDYIGTDRFGTTASSASLTSQNGMKGKPRKKPLFFLAKS